MMNAATIGRAARLIVDLEQCAMLVETDMSAPIARGMREAAGLLRDLVAEHEGTRTLGETLLTARELEIHRRVQQRERSKSIARELGLSVRTVETHRLNIRRKIRMGGANG